MFIGRSDAFLVANRASGLNNGRNPVFCGLIDIIAERKEGIVAVERIADHHPVPINYRQVPGCTYCEPQVASVGLTEAKAVEAGYKVKVGKFPFMAVGKAKIEEATDGFIKVVADENLREILGVHMIGHTVTEMIPEAVAAMALESTVDDVVNMIHAHPTVWEAMGDAFASVRGLQINV